MKTQKIHERYTILETERLTAEGFRCIPLMKKIPDIIAIKGMNLEVYAVEVIHKAASRPLYAQYKNLPWSDDVIVSVYPLEPPQHKRPDLIIVKSNGRITLPKEIREKLDLREDSVLEMENYGNEKILITVLRR